MEHPYSEREKELFVIRLFILIVLGAGAWAGIRVLFDKPTPENGITLGWKCISVPVLFFAFFMILVFLAGIKKAFGEQREHRRLVRERGEREQAENPKPQPKPVIKTVSEDERIKNEREKYQTERRAQIAERSARLKANREKKRQEKEDAKKLYEINRIQDERARIEALREFRKEQFERITK